MPRKYRKSRPNSSDSRPASQSAFARTTITIPRKLKDRMDGVGSRMNWSAIASEAFELQLAKLEVEELPVPELPDRDDALERLRRLKNGSECQQPETSGRAYILGKRWAMADAHPMELERLEDFFRRREIDRPLEELETEFDGPRAVKELYSDLTLSVLGYKKRPGSVDQARLYPADREHVRHKMKPFWEERVGVTLDVRYRHGPEFLSEFTKGALEFWKEAKDQL